MNPERHPGDILILTRSHDTHARIVDFCLHEQGYDTVYLHTDLITSVASIDFHIGPDSDPLTRICLDGREHDLDRVGTVWNRRHVNPTLSSSALCAQERELVLRETSVYSRSLVTAMCPDAFWVNTIEGENRANAKQLQLTLAKACALTVPETVIGNDPAAIRSLVAREECVYKALTPLAWKELNEQFAVHTSMVTPSDLPADEDLRLLPGIFQQRVRKQSDIRLFITGNTHDGLEMPLADNAGGDLDIRATPLHERHGHAFEAPPALLGECRALMARLGIVCGAFDFIRDLEGRLVFLEVNPGGQFIWMEQMEPASRALANFLNFISGSTNFSNYTARRVFASPAWQAQRRQQASTRGALLC